MRFRPLALMMLVLCTLLCTCMQLDGFLFAPTTAADDADLFAQAQHIPKELKKELRGVMFADDGTDVSGWALVHDANNPRDTTFVGRHKTGIVYCHGNSQNLMRYALRVQALWALGYTVLAFDYRGYGKTRGVPSEQGSYADARAARKYMSQKMGGLGILEHRVALYGYSLGAAVCSQLATEMATNALILEAPFASVASLVGDDSALGLPQAGFTKARYDTQHKLAAFKGGLLVMHGDNDHYLMPRYGAQVSQAAKLARPNVFIAVPGADHETVPCAVKDARHHQAGACLGGIDAHYSAWVADFIDGIVGLDL